MENWQCHRLISLYKGYKCLWDSNDTSYSNRSVRDDAWRHISREMEYPVETLKKKMKSLSGGYRREKFREKQSRTTASGAGDAYKSKWFAYKDFAFLTDKNEPGTTRDTLQNSEEIIARVYNYLQTEYEELKSSLGPSVDLSPLANILKRTAAATGISEHNVSVILEEKKRLAGDERDAGTAKRAKLTHDAGDGSASSTTDEESSCEAPDKEQDNDNEQTQDESQEQDDGILETLKVEIEDETYPTTEEESSCEAPDKEQDDENEQTQDESQDQDDGIMETLKVEIEDETYYRPSDPLQLQSSEKNSVVEYLTKIANVAIKTDPVKVKTEPIDTEYPHSTACASDMVSVTLCDVTNVKCEPPP